MILSENTRHNLSRVGILAALPFAMAVLCAPAIFAQAESEPQAKLAAAESEVAPEDKLLTNAYKVADLPVWSKDGAFDPLLLMICVQSEVDPEAWETLGGASHMAPYEKNASLVISTTRNNHEEISSLLKRLRSLARR